MLECGISCYNTCIIPCSAKVWMLCASTRRSWSMAVNGQSHQTDILTWEWNLGLPYKVEKKTVACKCHRLIILNGYTSVACINSTQQANKKTGQLVWEAYQDFPNFKFLSSNWKFSVKNSFENFNIFFGQLVLHVI